MKLLLGDCLEQMKRLPSNSVSAVVTDPPYGLSFMGKRWDYDVPSIAIWKEVLRILKPGAHILSFGGTRTYHRMVVNIEDAGFEIRDQLQWIYGSGFPKSNNIGKAVEKKYEKTEANGFGTALKPANEPIVLARRPFDGTAAQNARRWKNSGGLNIDASRIGYKPDEKVQTFWNNRGGATINASEGIGTKPFVGQDAYDPSNGRWPANVLFDESAAEMLDEQSGDCKTGAFKRKEFKGATQQPAGWKTANRTEKDFGSGSSGGASRFFYVAKCSKRERNAGLEGMPLRISGGMSGTLDGTLDGTLKTGSGNERNNLNQNSHPTVKPTKLMEYLIRLITPQGGVVLDPFMGSGSTGVAAIGLGFDFIGIEKDPDYFEICKKRIQHAEKQRKDQHGKTSTQTARV